MITFIMLIQKGCAKKFVKRVVNIDLGEKLRGNFKKKSKSVVPNVLLHSKVKIFQIKFLVKRFFLFKFCNKKEYLFEIK